MTDRSLLDRWYWMMRVSPHDEDRKNSQNSWNENTKHFLSTEKKIYAIKISDGEIVANYQQGVLRKKTSKGLQVKKWLEKFKWKFPTVIFMFSAIQVSLKWRNC